MKIVNLSCIVIATAILLAFNACEPKEKAKAPVVITDSVYSVGTNTATCKGHIEINSQNGIKAYGVCWGTNPNPTISDNNQSVTFGDFIFKITGLTPLVYHKNNYTFFENIDR